MKCNQRAALLCTWQYKGVSETIFCNKTILREIFWDISVCHVLFIEFTYTFEISDCDKWVSAGYVLGLSVLKVEVEMTGFALAVNVY